MPKQQRPEARLLLEGPNNMTLPGEPGRKLLAFCYASPTRRTGRRVIVEEAGAIVFDSDNCYDWGNAANRLNNWVLDQMKCVHCGTVGLTDSHGQDAESGLPICEECCTKAAGGQRASMSQADLEESVKALAEVKREEPADLAAVAVDEVGDDDGFPNEFPF